MSGGSVPSTTTGGIDDGQRRCAVWGVLNVTPDSFSDGGRFVRTEDAIAHGLELTRLGADVIDVGGESTRPKGGVYGEGFAEVSAEEERERVAPVVRELVAAGTRVSVDTTKTDVARACLDAGAHVINDVSCGANEEMLELVGAHGAELVLMHNRRAGEIDGDNVVYDNLLDDVHRELDGAAERAVRRGVDEARIWFDPGVGFAKTSAQSALLSARIDELVAWGRPVLYGPSRKSFIAAIAPDADGEKPAPQDREGGTCAAVVIAALAGVAAVRVHEVRQTRQAIRFAEALRSHGLPSGGRD